MSELSDARRQTLVGERGEIKLSYNPTAKRIARADIILGSKNPSHVAAAKAASKL